MEPLFPARPESFEGLSAEEIQEFITDSQNVAAQIHGGEADIGERSPDELLAEMTSGVEGIEAARAALAALEAEEKEDVAEGLEQLAARARGETEEPADEPEGDESADEEPETAAVVDISELVAAKVAEALAAKEPEVVEDKLEEKKELVAAAKSKPARSDKHVPVQQTDEHRPVLTASAEGMGYAIGEEIPDELSLAAAMRQKRENFGFMTSSEKVPVARLDWRDFYPADRMLKPADGPEIQMAKMAAVVAAIMGDPNRGTDKALVASGGICAPVTPYYQLQMISQAMRPVRASLPAFVADRGGIRFAAPPKLSAVTTAVGTKTAAQDAAGGSDAVKTCQVLVCPPFSEVDVEIIYHCVQTSNLTYRTFPEQLAQFNNLVLAAHARLAETILLDGIKSASTAVTATDIGLGAVGNLLGEILAAANGMRSRHRMDPEAVLRLMLPEWAIDLLISDVIRSQFQRFDTDEAKITALLRSFDVEPSFYIDSATGQSQVFGAQSAGALLPFPATVDWALFPEGSFLYLDGGTLELGLVRDSVLNKTNEFQIFGESFENVAFIGVESLYVTSTICDSGATSAPFAVLECGDYGSS